MAEEIAAAEQAAGLASVCMDGNNAQDISEGCGAQVHVVHTHLPDAVDIRRTKIVYAAHGTPEYVFKTSMQESAKGHGASDSWMVNLYWLQHADAIVTFWPRHAAIFKSMVDRHTAVDCIPMGIDLSKWTAASSRGKWAGSPSMLTAENCHDIKWPLDLMIAMTWVFDEIRTARLHLLYLPSDQARWWGSLTFRNGSAYRSFISSIALSQADLANAFASVDYYIGLVRYGDFNRICLEAKAAGCPVISYRGNDYADYWLDEGDQRVMAEQIKMILRGEVEPRKTAGVPDIAETARALSSIYERLL